MQSVTKQKPSYAEAFAEFKKHANINKIFEDMYDDVDKSYLNDVQRVISIGPGPGINDLTFLKKLAPNLTHFTAVEINKSCIEELTDNLKKFFPSNVNAEIYQESGPNWIGPGEPKADLVLMFHILYYFNKEERSVMFKKCFNNWLKPDGKLFIMNSKDKHESIRTCFLNDIYREIGRAPQVECFTIKEELIKLGYVVDRVYSYEFYYDLKTLNDLVVAFIMINADLPCEDEKIVRNALKNYTEKSDKGYSSGDLFSLIRKG